MTAPRLRYAHSLPAQALKYLNIQSSIQLIIVMGSAAALVSWLVPEPWRTWILIAVPALTVISLLVELPFMNRLEVKHTSYEVSATEVRLRKGVLFTRDTVISAAQILNVSVAEGPLLRRFGLAKVQFTSISHIEPLGPVTLEQANSIRATLLGIYASATTPDSEAASPELASPEAASPEPENSEPAKVSVHG